MQLLKYPFESLTSCKTPGADQNGAKQKKYMNNINVLFSKKSDEWATPQNIFNELNNEFNFNLDVCATSENAKCKRLNNLG